MILPGKTVGRWAGFAMVGAVLSGCSGSTSASAPAATHRATATATATPTHLPAEISVTPADHTTDVPLNNGITVRAPGGGSLDSVAVRADGATAPVPGALDAGSHTWQASDLLDPETAYTVEASARGPAGDTTTTKTRFTTVGAHRLTTDTTPNDNDTVGVGMPIMLRFNSSIAADKQAELLKLITVTATPAAPGAWHWFAPTEVHWRPEVYWAPGTKVHVDAKFRGLDLGNGYWGLNDWTLDFGVGEKHISWLDAATHQMTVTKNDQTVYTWPVSMGRPRNPTIGGTLVVRYKQQDVLMDSLTIGIPRKAPDGYYEHVYWDTAVSTNGFFVHAAPWDIPQQGYVNVSHGCINLSPDRARTFYEFSQPGDVVVSSNTGRIADAGDGEGDWQIPFDQFANTGSSAAAATTNPGGA